MTFYHVSTHLSAGSSSFLAIRMGRKGKVSWEMDERIEKKKKRKVKLAKLTTLFAHLLIVQQIKMTLKHKKDTLCSVLFYYKIGCCIIVTVCNKQVHFAPPSAKFSLFFFFFPLRFFFLQHFHTRSLTGTFMFQVKFLCF